MIVIPKPFPNASDTLGAYIAWKTFNGKTMTNRNSTESMENLLSANIRFVKLNPGGDLAESARYWNGVAQAWKDGRAYPGAALVPAWQWSEHGKPEVDRAREQAKAEATARLRANIIRTLQLVDDDSRLLRQIWNKEVPPDGDYKPPGRCGGRVCPVTQFNWIKGRDASRSDDGTLSEWGAAVLGSAYGVVLRGSRGDASTASAVLRAIPGRVKSNVSNAIILLRQYQGETVPWAIPDFLYQAAAEVPVLRSQLEDISRLATAPGRETTLGDIAPSNRSGEDAAEEKGVKMMSLAKYLPAVLGALLFWKGNGWLKWVGAGGVAISLLPLLNKSGDAAPAP